MWVDRLNSVSSTCSGRKSVTGFYGRDALSVVQQPVSKNCSTQLCSNINMVSL